MRRISIGLLLLMTTLSAWADEGEVYLEGISVVGAKKSAYISVNGDRVTVNEGDNIGQWQVIRIEPRAVFLKMPKGNETEFRVHSRMSLAGEKSATGNVTPPAPPQADNTPPVQNGSNTENVPQGYRKMRTPFGEFIVPDNQKKSVEATTNTTPNPQTTGGADAPTRGNATIPDDQVPPGHHKLKTPFGEIIVKDSP